MTTLTIAEINCSTGEVIERPYTTEELKQRDIDNAAFAKAEAEREAKEKHIAALKESAKAKLIAGEPLTEEEASVLVI